MADARHHLVLSLGTSHVELWVSGDDMRLPAGQFCARFLEPAFATLQNMTGYSNFEAQLAAAKRALSPE